MAKIDLTGQRFGKLTVLRDSGKRTAAHLVLWKCQCDCGNITYVSTDSLQSGSAQSCGCQVSRGEAKIISLLEKYNIPFKKQYHIIDTFGDRFFDFAILDSNNNVSYLIEYDGIQHFETSNHGWNTNAHLELTRTHDQEKNQWSYTHHIPLIRIPYTQY